MSNQIRVAGYARTSGEGQRDNTSIPRQKEAIEAFCKLNGWKLIGFYIDECRSGSKVEGRDEYRRMLADAASGCFDLICPYNVTRFGRDGVDIVSAAKLLKLEFGIVTVDAVGQFDNRSHKNSLANFVHAGVSEWERLSIMDRMIGGKIKRAKDDNIPTTGRLPYGRTWDPESGWGLDEEKVELIRELAERFLQGESLRELAKEFPLTYSQLWKTFRNSLGDTWDARYKVPELEIEETITHKVPPLLPEKTIREIHDRLERNKRFNPNGSAKYLLGGRIFCANCGCVMTGTRRPNGTRFYRHNFRHGNGCEIRPRPCVRADMIELQVLGSLFDLFGSPQAIERAVKNAVPEHDKLLQQRERISKELKKVQEARGRFMYLIERGSLKMEHAESKLNELDEKENAHKDKLARISDQLESIPDMADFSFGKQILEAIVDDFLGLDDGDEQWDDKKKLIDHVFSGMMPDGSPEGVYVTTDGPQQFSFVLKGRLATVSPSTDQRR